MLLYRTNRTFGAFIFYSQETRWCVLERIILEYQSKYHKLNSTRKKLRKYSETTKSVSKGKTTHVHVANVLEVFSKSRGWRFTLFTVHLRGAICGSILNTIVWVPEKQKQIFLTIESHTFYATCQPELPERKFKPKFWYRHTTNILKSSYLFNCWYYHLPNTWRLK